MSEFWLRDGDGAVVSDLFGQPVPARRGKRGRPAHEVTAQTRGFVWCWFAAGYDEDQIAEALGISPPTLRKYYFSELSGKRTSRMRLEAKNMLAIVEAVDKGNAAAMALLDKKIERWKLGPSGAKPGKVAKPPKLGKKEQAIIDAHRAGEDTSWGSLLN